jgi:hypothetical protein
VKQYINSLTQGRDSALKRQHRTLWPVSRPLILDNIDKVAQIQAEIMGGGKREIKTPTVSIYKHLYIVLTVFVSV